LAPNRTYHVSRIDQLKRFRKIGYLGVASHFIDSAGRFSTISTRYARSSAAVGLTWKAAGQARELRKKDGPRLVSIHQAQPEKDQLNAEVEAIRTASDIVSVVGEYVTLKRLGARPIYTGLCPFHIEKTPSFRVRADRHFWKCFACGRGGDVFTFVQEIEQVNFYGALRRLAERAGIRLDEWTPADATRDRLAEQIAEETSYWQMGSIGLCEQQQRDALSSNDLERIAPAAQRLCWLRSAEPTELVRAYVDARRRRPEAVSEAINWAREDIRWTRALCAWLFYRVVLSRMVYVTPPELAPDQYGLELNT
jgi:hypothetical protein